MISGAICGVIKNSMILFQKAIPKELYQSLPVLFSIYGAPQLHQRIPMTTLV